MLIRVEVECIYYVQNQKSVGEIVYKIDYDNDSEHESAYIWPYSFELLVDEVKNQSCKE